MVYVSENPSLDLPSTPAHDEEDDEARQHLLQLEKDELVTTTPLLMHRSDNGHSFVNHKDVGRYVCLLGPLEAMVAI
ncbi:hypothetical protein E2C01_101351 [Portunus trituberculatus]|uniref:Uncharacterized protein n=1 Tax=Portunus trituberculatus TaxID=210409 RepID=A0A5B7KEJ1_PORTR|nr:hypothetical protein [Portunus trituberculatus]